ncbi:MAG: carbonic anhydrase family protein [Chlorobi bacterium]|nr:carbonic anhydrase family protein [Chlorobiota bacterium]
MVKETIIHKWAYTGKHAPEFWADLCPEYSDCNGKHQSPIDIKNAKINSILKPPEFNYKPANIHIVNNDLTVLFKVNSDCFVHYNSKKYKLLQFHFHSHSEHTVNGKYYPLEIHFVHKAAKNDLLVIGVFVDTGNKNHFFQEWLNKIPKANKEYKSNQKFDALQLIPDNKTYYLYSGSLTTPPCSEIVNWLVFSKSLTATQYQLNYFASILKNNFRPLMLLNNRKISIFNDKN